QWARHKGRYCSTANPYGSSDYRPGPTPTWLANDPTPLAPGQPLPPVIPGEPSSGESVDEPVAAATGDGTQYILNRLSAKEEQVLAAHCPQGERPWLVINPGSGAGYLAAFEKELIIAKTSFAAGLGAGTLGGRRVTHFPYKQITGIEYNAGMLTGVLEILTPSYQGSANKDYWKGLGKGSNTDSNDPFKMSNTLPLSKPGFATAAPAIQQLRERVSAAHEVQVVVQANAAPTSSSIADELRKLADLKDQGILTDEEFTQAKARILNQGS
ncbi:MAG: SHOCT domain-containing protein, partial [Actinomycetales bacterium]